MTVLGAVVFGGFLALGVLWLLLTAPGSDVETDPRWDHAQNSAAISGSRILTHSSYN